MVDEKVKVPVHLWLVGAVLLLFRRKIAVGVMAFAWACSCVASAYGYFRPPPIAAPSAGFYISVLLIAPIILGYMHWLSRRGVLR